MKQALAPSPSPSPCPLAMASIQEEEKEEEKEEKKMKKSSVDSLPADVLAFCLLRLLSFKDLAQASRVCKKWRDGVKHALAYRNKLNFAGWRIEDSCVTRLVEGALNLQELDISSGTWGCRITDFGLKRISLSLCCPNLTTISLWGVTGITDEGVVALVCQATSLKHFNVGGTFITDASLHAIAKYSWNLKALNLWGCRHITESGVLALGKGCLSLHSINVWGLKLSADCYKFLLLMNPQLQLKPVVTNTVPYWQTIQ